MEKQNILVLTSSFPASQNNNIGGGQFVFTLCKKISDNVNPIVLAPIFKQSPKYETIDSLEIFRFGYLPFSNWYNYFRYGIFYGFKSKLWLKPFLSIFLIL